jgi:hypothetical protein
MTTAQQPLQQSTLVGVLRRKLNLNGGWKCCAHASEKIDCAVIGLIL